MSGARDGLPGGGLDVPPGRLLAKPFAVDHLLTLVADLAGATS